MVRKALSDSLRPVLLVATILGTTTACANPEGGPHRCEEPDFHQDDYDAPTHLHITGNKVLAEVVGEYPVVWRWAGEHLPLVDVTPNSSNVPGRLVISPREGPLIQSRRSEAHACVDGECRTTESLCSNWLELPVRIELSSQDGGFDEAWDSRVVVRTHAQPHDASTPLHNSDLAYSIEHKFTPADLEGSFKVDRYRFTPADRNHDIETAFSFELDFHPGERWSPTILAKLSWVENDRPQGANQVLYTLETSFPDQPARSPLSTERTHIAHKAP